MKKGFVSFPSLSNFGEKKEVRFETSPSRSSDELSSVTSNKLSSRIEMSERPLPITPVVPLSETLVVYPKTPPVHLPEPEVGHASLPVEESQPNEPLLDRPLDKNPQQRNDDGRSSHASPGISTNNLAGTSKTSQKRPTPLLRKDDVKYPNIDQALFDEESVVSEQRVDVRGENSDGSEFSINLTPLEDEFQALLPPNERRKWEEAHDVLWRDQHITDSFRAWIYNEDPDSLKQLHAANKLIEKVNKKKGYEPSLGTLPISRYSVVLNAMKEQMSALQVEENEDTWRNWAICKNAIQIVNLNHGFPEKFNLPRNYLQDKIGIRDRAQILWGTDEQASPDPSSESAYLVEAVAKENPHHAQGSQSSGETRRDSTQGKREQRRHDKDPDNDDGHYAQRGERRRHEKNPDNDDAHYSERSQSSGKTRRALSKGRREPHPQDIESHNEDGDDHDNNSNEDGTEGEESEEIEEESSEDDSDLDDIDSNLDDSPAGLRKAIEARYDIPMIGTVLGYRRCGPFYYQCLVQYGDDDAPTYRMLPGGSAGPWDIEDVIDLVADQRGPLRTRTDWAYKEDDILRIAGVAWKPYDEHSLNPLASLKPKNFQTTPPSTYVVVIWKDNARTFETRGSMRRILGNKRSGAPDLAILHQAQVQEKKYLEARTRAQSSSMSQKRKGHMSNTARRSREELEKLPRKAVRTADVRKGDSRKVDSRKADSRKGDSRKASSHMQSQTSGRASSKGDSMRLFRDDPHMPSNPTGQQPPQSDFLRRDEMVELLNKYFQNKAPSMSPLQFYQQT